MKKIFATICLCVLACIDTPAQEQDRLLGILKDELNREYTQLQKQPVKPYFMSFRVDEFRQVTLQSNMGTVIGEDDQSGRTLTPQIRVGSPRLDNFKFNTQGYPAEQGRDVAPWFLPAGKDDEDGLRAGIWSELRRHYDYAATAYREALAKASTTVADEDTASSFSVAPVVRHYEQPLDHSQTGIDIDQWKARLNAVTAAMAQCQDLQEGSAALSFKVNRQYIVNTEGTEIVQNRVAARVMITAKGMAPDGMVLPIMFDYFASSIDSLPSVEVMKAKADELVARVRALMKAPVANPYTGPAILSGPASGVFFHEIFGHRLESHRLKSGGETFRNMVGKKVLPEDFNVYCDPSLSSYRGMPLNGHYRFDDEGVAARRVQNIKEGILREFLLSRVPMDGFPASNGHGRAAAGHDAVSRQSNLIVETSRPQTEAALRSMLKAEAKRQGKEYGYYILTVTGGYTTTGQGNTMNSFNVSPVEVLRVYVDGRPDELVRGVDLIGTPLSMFSHIAAAGDSPVTFTGSCGAESGWVPVSCVSPAIYVSQIETQRRKKAQYTPPILKAPELANQTATSLEDAVRNETMRAATGLQVQGEMRPLLISSIISTSQAAKIVGELGAVSVWSSQPETTNIATEVIVGDTMHSSIVEAPRYYNRVAFSGHRATLTPEDILSARRAVWSTADNAYKAALNIYMQKQNYYAQNPLPESYAHIPELRLPAAGSAKGLGVGKASAADTLKMRQYAVELSAVFKDYPRLFDTSVTVDAALSHATRITSSGLEVKDDQQWVTITADATTQCEDGTQWKDRLNIFAASCNDLSSVDSLRTRVRQFADRLVMLLQAPVMDEDYDGPLMLEGEAAGFALSDNIRNMVTARHPLSPSKDDYGQKAGEQVVDSRISVVNYSDKAEYQGTPLLGAYSVDCDGVTPEQVQTLIKDGVLQRQLNDLRPLPASALSTGSSRFSANPVMPVPAISTGTMHIRATGTTAEEKMMKMLTKAAKKAGKKNAYIVSLDEGGALLRLYRVNLKSGTRQLLRSDNIGQVESGQLKSILALSSSEIVINDTDGTINSVITPRSFILEKGELHKSAARAVARSAVSYPLAEAH